MCGKIILHFFRHASRGTAWPLHFKFVSYAYAVEVFKPWNLLQYTMVILGTVHSMTHPLSLTPCGPIHSKPHYTFPGSLPSDIKLGGAIERGYYTHTQPAVFLYNT